MTADNEEPVESGTTTGGSLRWWQSLLRLHEWQGISGILAIVSLIVAVIALRPSSDTTPDPSSSTHDPDLSVSFLIDQTGANMLIGNQGKSIIATKDLTIHWKYSKCPKFEKPTYGAVLVTYRYEVDLSTGDGSKTLDTKEFEYGEGDVDKFLVDLHYPDYGVYTVWVTFNYTRLGENSSKPYRTTQEIHEVCQKS